ncbi:MAG: DMT family transporter [Trueperaceae bacterium]|nr:DMT family transporter [Trueperaceae bacterium]
MKGYLFVITAAVLWGLIGLFSKSILNAGVGALEISFWRALLGGALFVIHAGATQQLRLQPGHAGRDLGAFAGFAVFGVIVFYTSLNLAIDSGGVSLAFILLYSAPAFVAVTAWLLLGETLTPRKLALLGVTMLGVVLVSQGSGSGVTISPLAVFWGLLAGLSYASYYIFGKWILKRYAPVTIFAIILPMGALGLWPLVEFSPKSMAVWLTIGLLALVSTYAAYLIYYTGLQLVEASRASLVATIEPVVAAGLAAVVFGERLGTLGLVGGALIIVGALLASLPERRFRALVTPQHE